jgi:hypothetical protein
MDAAPPARGTRILVFVATLLAATNMVDFLFYGKYAHDLLAAIGMALIAHAAYYDGFRPIAELKQRTGPAARAYYSSIGGVVLMIVSMILKYAF